MKILFSITYYHPYISGLTIAASRWAEALIAEGKRVSVITMQHDQYLPRTARIGNVMVHRVPWIVSLHKGFISIAWLLSSWRLTGSCDVTVVHLPQFEGVVTALAAKLQGKRVVAVYHCEVVLPEGFINSVIQSLLELSHMVTLLVADSVVTYTRDYEASSQILGLFKRLTKRKVIAIVPPIAVPNIYKQTIVDIQKKVGKADVVIGIAARLAAEKGIEYVLESLPVIQKHMRGKTVKIVIAGPMEPVGEEAYKEKIMKLVHKLRKHVVFLGSITPREMGSFYQCIDVLALPSINSTEAFGMVQVEAMLCGVPVVASALPGVRVPVTLTGMGTLVPPAKSQLLADAIIKVVGKKATLATLQRKALTVFAVSRARKAWNKLFTVIQ